MRRAGGRSGVRELTGLVDRLSGETSRQGSLVRFQTVNKRLGKHELVPGVEPIGQTGGMGVEDRPRVCALEVK